MQQKPKYFKGRVIKENEHRINKYITAQEVRLVGENVEPGLYPIAAAMAIADELMVDLVEISNNSTPPICRCVDYNKFLYEKKKKDKEKIVESADSPTKT